MKRLYYYHFVTLLILTVSLTSAQLPLNNAENKNSCEQNYSPCTCTNIYGIIITCAGIDLEEVRQVFNRTSADGAQHSDNFYLTLPSLTNAYDILTIPADLVNDQAIDYIYITCPSTSISRRYQFRADPESFRSTRLRTKSLSVTNCDLSLLDLGFLAGFDALTNLNFDDSSDVQTSLMSLPVLPTLTGLSFYSCPDFGSSNSFPTLNNGLNYLSLGGNGWTDERVTKIINWILETSIDSLTELLIFGNTLSVPPPQIARFTRLNFLWLRDNTGPLTLTSSSLTFQFPVFVLDVSNNAQLILEAGAFQGNYGPGTVSLTKNKLTRFEESVFYPVLQDMPIYSRGFVDVDQNPFDCENDRCHLAWLIRDHRELLPFVYNAKCSNGISFQELNGNDYIDCP